MEVPDRGPAADTQPAGYSMFADPYTWRGRGRAAARCRANPFRGRGPDRLDGDGVQRHSCGAA